MSKLKALHKLTKLVLKSKTEAKKLHKTYQSQIRIRTRHKIRSIVSSLAVSRLLYLRQAWKNKRKALQDRHSTWLMTIRSTSQHQSMRLKTTWCLYRLYSWRFKLGMGHQLRKSSLRKRQLWSWISSCLMRHQSVIKINNQQSCVDLKTVSKRIRPLLIDKAFLVKESVIQLMFRKKRQAPNRPSRVKNVRKRRVLWPQRRVQRTQSTDNHPLNARRFS